MLSPVSFIFILNFFFLSFSSSLWACLLFLNLVPRRSVSVHSYYPYIYTFFRLFLHSPFSVLIFSIVCSSLLNTPLIFSLFSSCSFFVVLPSPAQKGVWTHIRCALSLNALITHRVSYELDDSRSRLRCIVCHHQGPAPARCGHSNCTRSYHVSCATATPGCMLDWDSGRPLVFCSQHAKNKAPTLVR